MNAGADWNLSTYLTVYKAITVIKDRDYDKWIKMSKDELFNHVMKETMGRVNPSDLRKAIDAL